MRKQYLLLLITTFFLFPGRSVFAAVENKKEEEKLLEELTGKKAPAPAVTVAAPSAVKSEEKSMSRRLLDAGYYAYTQKEFIEALKYYNTIIVKYPNTPEVRLAYLGKVKLYNEMGLEEQAQRNLKIANEMTNKTQNIK
ncbi:MAG: hypothetical protein ACXWQQ_10060 [Pseudobdellovibrio sp.]